MYIPSRVFDVHFFRVFVVHFFACTTNYTRHDNVICSYFDDDDNRYLYEYEWYVMSIREYNCVQDFWYFLLLSYVYANLAYFQWGNGMGEGNLHGSCVFLCVMEDIIVSNDLVLRRRRRCYSYAEVFVLCFVSTCSTFCLSSRMRGMHACGMCSYLGSAWDRNVGRAREWSANTDRQDSCAVQVQARTQQ